MSLPQYTPPGPFSAISVSHFSVESVEPSCHTWGKIRSLGGFFLWAKGTNATATCQNRGGPQSQNEALGAKLWSAGLACLPRLRGPSAGLWAMWAMDVHRRVERDLKGSYSCLLQHCMTLFEKTHSFFGALGWERCHLPKSAVNMGPFLIKWQSSGASPQLFPLAFLCFACRSTPKSVPKHLRPKL